MILFNLYIKDENMNSEEFESWLRESANILRGPVDVANLRDYVFPSGSSRFTFKTKSEVVGVSVHQCLLMLEEKVFLNRGGVSCGSRCFVTKG